MDHLIIMLYLTINFSIIYVQIDWLNKFIEKMWPYLDKVLLAYFFPLVFNTFDSIKVGSDDQMQAICKQVKTIVDPIIAEQIPQYKIDSVQFEVLSLGCLPPAFTG